MSHEVERSWITANGPKVHITLLFKSTDEAIAFIRSVADEKRMEFHFPDSHIIINDVFKK